MLFINTFVDITCFMLFMLKPQNTIEKPSFGIGLLGIATDCFVINVSRFKTFTIVQISIQYFKRRN